MYKTITAVIGCMVLSATCLAQPFQLKDDRTGKLYGPFEFKDRAKVLIGQTSFTLVKPERTESALEKKMKEIKIPEVNLVQANMRVIADWLRNESVKLDRSKDPGSRKGVNIVLDLKGADASPVTFKARDVSLFEVIKTVTQMANLKYRIDGNMVMIEPKK